jgi:dihydrolipoamide dehydrogenase
VTRIVIMGGGPAGYEAALVAAQHGADVTIVEREGPGGACVLYDCVPSKTFIASAGGRSAFRNAGELGIRTNNAEAAVELPVVHGRVKGLALAQSADVRARLQREGVRIVNGIGKFCDNAPGLAQHEVVTITNDGVKEVLPADVVLIATGATPRVLPGAEPDGKRILTWRQIYG